MQITGAARLVDGGEPGMWYVVKAALLFNEILKRSRRLITISVILVQRLSVFLR